MSRLDNAVKVVGPDGAGWNDYEKRGGIWYETGSDYGPCEISEEDVLYFVNNQGFTIVEREELT